MDMLESLQQQAPSGTGHDQPGGGLVSDEKVRELNEKIREIQS